MTSAAKRDRQGQSPSLYRLKELFTAAPISQRRPPGLPTPSSLLTHNPSISRWCIPLSYLSYTQYVQFNPELGNVCKGTVIRFLVHTSYRNCIFLSSFFRLVLMAFCVVGNGGHRRWLGYPRSGWLFYSPYQNEWADDPTGMGLLYYGQNFLIYPSAFPAGARESEHFCLLRTAGADYACGHSQPRRARPNRLFHSVHRPRANDTGWRQDQGVPTAAADDTEHERDPSPFGRRIAVGRGGTLG